MKLNFPLFQSLILTAFLLMATDNSVSGASQNGGNNKKMKVFILAGQSNMEGRADGRKLIQEDLSRLANASKNVQLAYNHEPVSPLRPVSPSPEIAKIYQIDLLFGPELFFGINLAEAWPGEKILLIKLSEGGTSLHGCWNPDWSIDKAKIMGEELESRLYQELISYVKQVLSGYDKDSYEICAMLWVQGETDSGNKIAASEYGTNLRLLIKQVRKDLNKPTLPFYLFEVGSGNVVDGMKQTSSQLHNVTLLSQSPDKDSEHFYQKMENGHYNYEGMKKLGQRFAQTYLDQHGRKVN